MTVSTNTRLSRKLLRLVMGDPILGQKIREARKDAGLSQPDLAKLVGLGHPQSISNYERGIGDVPPDRLRKIATATSRPLAFFYEEEPTPPSPSEDDRLERLEGAVESLRQDLHSFLERLSERQAAP